MDLPTVTALAACPVPGSDLLASGGFDGIVRLWDVRAPRARISSGTALSEKAASPGDAVTKLAFTGEAVTAATAGGDLVVYDMRVATVGRVHVQGSPAVTGFVALDASTVLLSCHDSVLRLVEIPEGGEGGGTALPVEPMCVYEGHKACTDSDLGLHVDSSSRYVSTCSEDGTVVVYDFVTGDIVQRLEESGRRMGGVEGGIVVGGRGGARVYKLRR